MPERSPAHEQGRKAEGPAPLRRFGLAVIAPLAILSAWQAAAVSGVIDPLFFPPPSSLFETFWRMMESGELPGHLKVTLNRMALGFLLGSLSGLIAGVVMGAVALVRQLLEPLVSAVYSTPKLTLLPMLMLFLGVGEAPRILLISLGCFIVVSLQALDAVRNVNPAFVDLAANYGASRAMIYRRVYLPSSLPQVFTGLRLALGRALVVTVSLELVSASNGLGSMIWMSWQTFSTDKLYIGVIVAGTLGALFHGSLKYLESRVIPWRS